MKPSLVNWFDLRATESSAGQDQFTERSKTMIKEEREVERHVRPNRGEPSYIFVRTPPPKRRRGWIRAIVVALIAFVFLAGGIGLYTKMGQLFQFFQPHNASVTLAAPRISAGQIHLTNVVQYAYQDFQATESATVTDQSVQECHPFWPINCQPVSVTETVTCTAFVEAGIDYDAHPPRLDFGSGSTAKTVTITVVSPTFLHYGITTTDIKDSSDKYGVTTDVTDRLLARCKNDVYTKAHDTQLLVQAKQHAQAKIIADAAAYGFKARVVFIDSSSSSTTSAAHG
jgi:hypothetical protein